MICLSVCHPSVTLRISPRLSYLLTKKYMILSLSLKWHFNETKTYLFVVCLCVCLSVSVCYVSVTLNISDRSSYLLTKKCMILSLSWKWHFMRPRLVCLSVCLSRICHPQNFTQIILPADKEVHAPCLCETFDEIKTCLSVCFHVCLYVWLLPSKFHPDDLTCWQRGA